MSHKLVQTVFSSKSSPSPPNLPSVTGHSVCLCLFSGSSGQTHPGTVGGEPLDVFFYFSCVALVFKSP